MKANYCKSSLMIAYNRQHKIIWWMVLIGDKYHKNYIKKINIKIKYIEVLNNVNNIGIVF